MLYGNLAPSGCVIKPPPPTSACSTTAARPSSSRTTTTWPARSNATTSTSRRTPSCPQERRPDGGPGMPEWGMMPIPKSVKQGVRDMLRISDARMSGTSTAPASSTSRRRALSAGPSLSSRLATNRGRRARSPIHLHVADEELARRRAAWKEPAPRYPRAMARFTRTYRPADEGCDFDFLAPLGAIPEPEIH